jgi:hypothetical protein
MLDMYSVMRESISAAAGETDAVLNVLEQSGISPLHYFNDRDDLSDIIVKYMARVYLEWDQPEAHNKYVHAKELAKVKYPGTIMWRSGLSTFFFKFEEYVKLHKEKKTKEVVTTETPNKEHEDTEVDPPIEEGPLEEVD